MVSLGNIHKRQRYDPAPKLLDSRPLNSDEWIPARGRKAKGTGTGVSAARVLSDTEDETDPKIKKFREMIKESERGTLLFNLDMGKVPLMNKETMNRKATLSLTSMAAKKEKRNTEIPSSEAIAAIDDLLSVTTGMQIYGATTKT
jgi:hypothetical protein